MPRWQCPDSLGSTCESSLESMIPLIHTWTDHHTLTPPGIFKICQRRPYPVKHQQYVTYWLSSLHPLNTLEHGVLDSACWWGGFPHNQILGLNLMCCFLSVGLNSCVLYVSALRQTRTDGDTVAQWQQRSAAASLHAPSDPLQYKWYS